MLQDQQACIDNHKRFVKRVAESSEVWGLESPKGWVVTESNESDGTEIMPFWSDKAYAARAAKEEWASFSPSMINLDEFIDRWLKGMNDEGVLVGTNWDTHLCGLEIEPAQLAQEILDELERIG
jgi:hypothetical protein